MSDRSVRSAVMTVLAVAALTSAVRAEAQVAHSLAGAPYAAGVSVAPHSTLAVLGGVEGHGDDAAAAATAALAALGDRLAAVGIDKRSVVRVRAALSPASADDFAAWNRAWEQYFDGTERPARVTVGASALPGGARLVLDVVAALPAAGGGLVDVPGARATANPNIRIVGADANPTVIVSTGAGLFLSSGVLPGRDGLADPESMEQHIGGAMSSLKSSLAAHNLEWSDAFFIRVLPTPQPSRTGVDFEGWTPVLASHTAAGFTGAWTMWAAPGFGATGRYVEIEVWAAPPVPDASFQTADGTGPRLRMTGTPNGMISSGALTAPDAELIFLSGIIAPEGTAPEEEGRAVLQVMRDRLTALGASMADVAELRVYRVDGEQTFNAAYGEFFNNSEMNPHRPVRTNYLVPSVPAGRDVEIEAIAVRRPSTPR